MTRHSPGQALPRLQVFTERTFAAFERFIHIQAASGAVLLLAAAIALIWSNSYLAASYHALWHLPLAFGAGDFSISQPLHFWINDGLMTIFFLVVGMEIRREIHEGSLNNIRQASLPIAAAIGGVIVPAVLYLLLNDVPLRRDGWAVPTATDIAFALGLMALLGRSIPTSLRIFLLALAIIDDIVAVLIIALFYSEGLDYSGFLVAAAGIIMVLALQRMGIGSAWAYILPGAVLWMGMLITGAHPTLAGVVLGLMTPVVSTPMRERPIDLMTRVIRELTGRSAAAQTDAEKTNAQLRQLRLAQRELLPPAMRVQTLLHPWVAFGIMPLFALANAGVSLSGIDLSADGALWVSTGILLALVVGKPVGILGLSWLVVRLGWCALPAGVSWAGITLVGLFAGVGFTMSIFIAMLAFTDTNLLNAAKLGILTGSVLSAFLGLLWGLVLIRRRSAEDGVPSAAIANKVDT